MSKAWLKSGLIFGSISAILSILGAIPLIKCLICPITCISWLLLPLLAGYLASTWAKVTKADISKGAIQGGLAGIVLGVISAVVSFVITIISTIFSLSLGTVFNLQDQTDYFNFLTFMPAGVTGAIICGLVGGIFGILFNMIVAGLGGIIKAAMTEKK